jgi:hypothetical protein
VWPLLSYRVIIVQRLAHPVRSLMVTVAWSKTSTARLCSLFADGTADLNKVGKEDTTEVWTADQAADGNQYFDGIEVDRFASNYRKQAALYLENDRLNGFGAYKPTTTAAWASLPRVSESHEKCTTIIVWKHALLMCIIYYLTDSECGQCGQCGHCAHRFSVLRH